LQRPYGISCSAQPYGALCLSFYSNIFQFDAVILIEKIFHGKKLIQGSRSPEIIAESGFSQVSRSCDHFNDNHSDGIIFPEKQIRHFNAPQNGKRFPNAK
jgi:hypothetical protein